MIIYNITFSVDESVEIDWLKWMKSEHISEMLACGIFTKVKLSRVIQQVDSNSTFAVAYTCKSMKDLNHYQIKYAAELQQKHISRYAEKVVSFRTIMEVIEEF
jgi:hypothetical protein